MIKQTAVLAVLSSVLAVACTKHVDGCDANSDCTDPAYPFCDVDGQYAPSGGNKNVCTIVPPGCPANVCGCSPGATTCATDQLTTCNADGMSTSTAGCALGCSDDGLACKSFTPSNGLGPTLLEAAGEPDVTIPSGSTIDTDTGDVTASNGTPLIVASSLVAQPTGMIRAFAAHSFTIADVAVAGSYPLALVAADDLTLNGILDASANGTAAGPGAQIPGTACDGGSIGAAIFEVLCGAAAPPMSICSPGPGGGGNATGGGVGGTNGLTSFTPNFGSISGGAAVTGFSPIVGGCSGGSSTDMHASTSAAAGAGGGAIQLVSGTSIELSGIVNVGGGGGPVSGINAAGGGAGGNIVIETPMLTIGTAGGFAANGGGGGGCSVAGADATPNDTAAVGGAMAASSCVGTSYSFSGGAGGTVELAPGSGGFDMRTPPIAGDFFGGGGGSVGRIRIATLDGTYASMPTSLMSAVVTTDTLVTQ